MLRRNQGKLVQFTRAENEEIEAKGKKRKRLASVIKEVWVLRGSQSHGIALLLLLFVFCFCLRFCINMYFFQCLPVIYL
jgi:hypothetical protein